MAVPTLNDWQFWFGFDGDGKLFGSGTGIDVVSVADLESIEVTSGTRTLPREDGSVPGLHLVRSKDPVLRLEPISVAEYEALRDVFTPSRNHLGELHWKKPGQDQVFMRARLSTRSHFEDGLTVELIPVNVVLEVADPRIYGVESKTQIVSIWNPTGGGIDWEIDWEVDWASGAGSGSDVVCYNAGNSKAFPIVKFFGPDVGTCDGVLLTNLTTGIELEITAAMLTGQVLTADMDARVRGTGTRIIDLSGASRYGDWELPRDTFYLQPGDNVVRFALTGGTSTDMTASLTWRDTYY